MTIRGGATVLSLKKIYLHVCAAKGRHPSLLSGLCSGELTTSIMEEFNHERCRSRNYRAYSYF